MNEFIINKMNEEIKMVKEVYEALDNCIKGILQIFPEVEVSYIEETNVYLAELDDSFYMNIVVVKGCIDVVLKMRDVKSRCVYNVSDKNKSIRLYKTNAPSESVDLEIFNIFERIFVYIKYGVNEKESVKEIENPSATEKSEGSESK